MAFCASCGAEVQGKFCAKCGTPAGASTSSTPGNPPPSSGAAAPGVIEENVVAALCYLVFVLTGILFLVLEPYNRNPVVRFHAFQKFQPRQ